jgi:hypothetical protein
MKVMIIVKIQSILMQRQGGVRPCNALLTSTSRLHTAMGGGATAMGGGRPWGRKVSRGLQGLVPVKGPHWCGAWGDGP